MAHQVETMFYANAKPWHGLGTELQGNITIPLAIEASGLNWNVSVNPIFDGKKTEIESHKCVKRDSDGAILGIVGNRFKPLQNIDAFSWFSPIVESGLATLETAGSLAEGKKIWILAKIKSDPVEVIANDLIEKFILLSHSHDGTLAVRAGFTPIRVVCNNTLSMAHRDDASKLIKFKHTENLISNLERVRDFMEIAAQEFKCTEEQFKLLASKDINQATLDKYFKMVFMPNRNDNEDEKLKRIIKKVDWVYHNGKGMNETKNTFWKAYNAVNETLLYHAGRNENNRLDSMWFGVNKSKDQHALDTALRMVAA